jgi:hypothetical protein
MATMKTYVSCHQKPPATRMLRSGAGSAGQAAARQQHGMRLGGACEHGTTGSSTACARSTPQRWHGVAAAHGWLRSQEHGLRPVTPCRVAMSTPLRMVEWDVSVDRYCSLGWLEDGAREGCPAAAVVVAAVGQSCKVARKRKLAVQRRGQAPLLVVGAGTTAASRHLLLHAICYFSAPRTWCG